MIIYKIGGSLFGSPRLRDWLRFLVRQKGVLIVPGGGPFADQVREAQRRWSFDDLTAHRMAVLAMQQYGRMLLGLEPRLRPWRLGWPKPQEAAVWLPEPEALDEAGLPGKWEITSDSLAAWLAREISAQKLVLVKSHPEAQGGRCDLQTLIDEGIVDEAFHVYSEGLRWEVRHRDEVEEMPA